MWLEPLSRGARTALNVVGTTFPGGQDRLECGWDNLGAGLDSHGFGLLCWPWRQTQA
jgi:hypothetical protein